MSDEETSVSVTAKTAWHAWDGVFVFTLEEEGEPPIVLRLGYGDCEWVVTACDFAARKRPFDKVLSLHAVAESGGRLLFARVTADAGRVGFSIEAPFGLMGWSCLFDGAEAEGIKRTARQAMRQADSR